LFIPFKYTFRTSIFIELQGTFHINTWLSWLLKGSITQFWVEVYRKLHAEGKTGAEAPLVYVCPNPGIKSLLRVAILNCWFLSTHPLLPALQHGIYLYVKISCIWTNIIVY